MSSRICQPGSQIRLTNVSIVRYKDGACVFELACYPNKVKDWQEGRETDITEVLQSNKIFSNVGKGQFAREVELISTFGTCDFFTCVGKILKQGTIQLSARERREIQERYLKDVYQMTSKRLLLLERKVSLTVEMIESAARDSRLVPKIHAKVATKTAASRLARRLVAEYPAMIGLVASEFSIDVSTASNNLKDETKKFLLDQIGAFGVHETSSHLQFYAPPFEAPKIIQFCDNILPLSVLNTDVAITHESLVLQQGDREKEEDDKELYTVKRSDHIGCLAELADSKNEDDLSDESTKEIHTRISQELLRMPNRKARQLELHSKKLEKSPPTRVKVQHVEQIDKIDSEESKPYVASVPPESCVTWCSQCELDFARTLQESIKHHMKSELHVYNVKLRLQGKSPVTCTEFEELDNDVREGLLAVQY